MRERRIAAELADRIDPQSRGDTGIAVRLLGDVQHQIAAAVARDLTEPPAGVNHDHADSGRLVEQRPELRAVPVGQVERPVLISVSVAIAARGREAGMVNGVELTRQREVILPVVRLAEAPGLERTPRQ